MTGKNLFIALGALCLIAVPVLLLAMPISDAQGTPNIEKAGTTGAYVWVDDKGFHARFTTKKNELFFHGKVCAAEILSLDGYHVDDDARNKVEISDDKKCINIDMYNKQALNGLNFKAKGKKIEFRLKVGDQDLSANRIWVGANNKNPGSSPFTIDR